MLVPAPCLVAGPFTHNSTLCDTAPGYAQGRQVLPSSALDLPPVAGEKERESAVIIIFAQILPGLFPVFHLPHVAVELIDR